MKEKAHHVCAAPTRYDILSRLRQAPQQKRRAETWRSKSDTDPIEKIRTWPRVKNSKRLRSRSSKSAADINLKEWRHRDFAQPNPRPMFSGPLGPLRLKTRSDVLQRQLDLTIPHVAKAIAADC